MKRIVRRLAPWAIALAAAGTGLHAGAVTVDFRLGGFSGGGTFTGRFSGEDLDGDGVLRGGAICGCLEITRINASFSGGLLAQPQTFGTADLEFLQFRIGDAIFGDEPLDILDLAAKDAMTGSASVRGSIGLAPIGQVSDLLRGTVAQSHEFMTVAAVGAPVPEPATVGLWIGGLAAVGAWGGAGRRRRRQ
jgi:hypothetical protein